MIFRIQSQYQLLGYNYLGTVSADCLEEIIKFQRPTAEMVYEKNYHCNSLLRSVYSAAKYNWVKVATRS